VNEEGYSQQMQNTQINTHTDLLPDMFSSAKNKCEVFVK